MSIIEFCKTCGSLLIPVKKGAKTVLVCRVCGKKATPKSKKAMKIETSGKKHEKIIIVDKKSNTEALPKTKIICPKCEHGEAYWWMEQTRASDEAPTRFYKCCNCKHTWREYS